MNQLPDKFEVTVTEEDLDKAIEEVKNPDNVYTRSCVIAQAVRRQFNNQVSVSGSGVVSDGDHGWKDGPEAVQIVLAFDRPSKQGDLRKSLPRTLKYKKFY